MKTKPLGMLEIAYDLGHDLSETSRRASRAFEIMATL
jgi:hypothetical protein